MLALPFGTILKAALIAGLAAGLTASVFHLVFTEPLIDRAVALEAHDHVADDVNEPALVSRDTQRKGLVVGFVLLGLTWSLIFGIAFQAAQRWLPATSRFRQGLVMALLAYWSVALLPFLKYPANPPGVGDAETIGLRQALYAAFLVLSISSVFLGGWLARSVLPALSRGMGLAAPGWAGVAVLGVIVFMAMPSAAVEVTIPADLLSTFRIASLAGLTVFWSTMGLLFGKLISGGPVRAA
ncbi:MAG: CbtA family protein [Chloroflexota bacterium]